MNKKTPIEFTFTYVTTDPTEFGTLIYNNEVWTSNFSWNKLVTLGMIKKLWKQGTLKDTGRYTVVIEGNKLLHVKATLYKKNWF